MKSIKIAAAAVCAIGILTLAGCNSAKNSGTATAATTTNTAYATETGTTTYSGEIFTGE